MQDLSLRLARRLVDILEEKKGEDIVLLDLAGVCTFTDYFVIATGISERTLRSLADDIRKKAKDEFDGALGRQEGVPSSGWILLDYGNVVVHLFSAEMRRYYELEQLWEAGKVLVRVQ